MLIAKLSQQPLPLNNAVEERDITPFGREDFRRQPLIIFFTGARQFFNRAIFMLNDPSVFTDMDLDGIKLFVQKTDRIAVGVYVVTRTRRQRQFVGRPVIRTHW